MSFYRPDIPITRLHLFLTTHCNLACSECCQNIPLLKNAKHLTLDEIKEVASIFHGIDHLRITGGEPTTHPDFSVLIPQLKELFGCRLLTLATDGYKVVENKHVLHHFDDIEISHYANNKKEVEFLAKHFHDSRTPGDTIHVTKTRRAANPHPCFRASGAVAYVHGRIYPCCVVPGPGGSGIVPTADWREKILKAPLHCETCFFAEEKDVLSPNDTAARGLTSDDISEAPSILGLTADSWFTDWASIRFDPPEEKKKLMIQFESLAPPSLHPITLTFESEDSALYTHTIEKVGKSRVNLPVGEWSAKKGLTQVAVRSDRAFVPAEFDSGNPDLRKLSVRILRARYQ